MEFSTRGCESMLHKLVQFWQQVPVHASRTRVWMPLPPRTPISKLCVEPPRDFSFASRPAPRALRMSLSLCRSTLKWGNGGEAFVAARFSSDAHTTFSVSFFRNVSMLFLPCMVLAGLVKKDPPLPTATHTGGLWSSPLHLGPLPPPGPQLPPPTQAPAPAPKDWWAKGYMFNAGPLK